PVASVHDEVVLEDCPPSALLAVVRPGPVRGFLPLLPPADVQPPAAGVEFDGFADLPQVQQAVAGSEPSAERQGSEGIARGFEQGGSRSHFRNQSGRQRGSGSFSQSARPWEQGWEKEPDPVDFQLIPPAWLTRL